LSGAASCKVQAASLALGGGAEERQGRVWWGGGQGVFRVERGGPTRGVGRPQPVQAAALSDRVHLSRLCQLSAGLGTDGCGSTPKFRATRSSFHSQGITADIGRQLKRRPLRDSPCGSPSAWTPRLEQPCGGPVQDDDAQGSSSLSPLLTRAGWPLVEGFGGACAGQQFGG